MTPRVARETRDPPAAEKPADTPPARTKPLGFDDRPYTGALVPSQKHAQ
jgi:hypothetical protein